MAEKTFANWRKGLVSHENKLAIVYFLKGGVELGGIYVKGLLPGGAADNSRKIYKG